MKVYSIKIKDKEFRVAAITDTEEMKKGLSGKPKLAEGKGLLFHFGEPQEITMNMVGMLYPLDMIFINGDRKVVSVESMKPGLNETTVKDVMCVLEVNKGEGAGLEGSELIPSEELVDAMMAMMGKEEEEEIKEEQKAEEQEPEYGGFNIVVSITNMPAGGKKLFREGGSFKIYEDSVKAKEGTMQVLDDGGRILMNIKGGERIFSIKDTDQIIALSKKIDDGKADPEELGRLMDTILHRQNTQKPEYV